MKYHVQVLLMTGVVQNYYIEDEPFKFEKFQVDGGWLFDGTDFFAPAMVMGISIKPFKGYCLTVGKQEVYCASTNDSDIIEALENVRDDLVERLQGVKDYLKCKPSS